MSDDERDKVSKLSSYDKGTHRKYMKKAEMEKSFHTLEGILKGIGIDNIIHKEEIVELIAWCDSHSCYLNVEPISEVINFIRQALEDGVLDKEEKENILWLCKRFKTNTNNVYFDVITSDIQVLEGILHGILADGTISDNEIVELKNWVSANDHLIGKYPYDEINSLLISVLSDGYVDDNERKMLEVFFNDFIEANTLHNLSKEELENLKKEICVNGICSICPEITLSDKTFCFTGASSRTSRKQINDIISSLGGLYNDNVTSKTDYLIIGNNGNSCWAFSCYGRKVEQAVNMRKKGHKIIIVHENDFWDLVEDIG